MQRWRTRQMWLCLSAVLPAGALIAFKLHADVAANPPSTNATPTSAAVVLPVVPRPAASQPAIGDPRDSHLDRNPPRQTKGLDLVKMGWSYNCMECHKLLPAKWHYDRPMAEHENIHLDHGNNRYCLNCHHPKNRNAFVDYDGAEIAEHDVVQLCAKCHGTIYRDWKEGVHGRRNGFWNKAQGGRTQLRCIQCHDPHQPKFKAMKPLAPLRYPERAAGHADHGQGTGSPTEAHR